MAHHRITSPWSFSDFEARYTLHYHIINTTWNENPIQTHTRISCVISNTYTYRALYIEEVRLKMNSLRYDLRQPMSNSFTIKKYLKTTLILNMKYTWKIPITTFWQKYTDSAIRDNALLDKKCVWRLRWNMNWSNLFVNPNTAVDCYWNLKTKKIKWN